MLKYSQTFSYLYDLLPLKYYIYLNFSLQLFTLIIILVIRINLRNESYILQYFMYYNYMLSDTPFKPAGAFTNFNYSIKLYFATPNNFHFLNRWISRIFIKSSFLSFSLFCNYVYIRGRIHTWTDWFHNYKNITNYIAETHPPSK